MCQSKVQSIEAVRKEFKDEAGKNQYIGNWGRMRSNLDYSKSFKTHYLCRKSNIKRNMKVLLINGSPHKEGNTFIALSEVAKALEAS